MIEKTLAAFADELSKIAAAGPWTWHDTAELGGLATLAAPHIYHAVTGKRPSHKTERNVEIAGLSTLAAPYLHKGVTKLLTKSGSVEKVGGIIRSFRPSPSSLKGSALDASFKAAKMPPAAVPKPRPLQRNPLNYTPETPTGSSWKTNPRAIDL